MRFVLPLIFLIPLLSFAQDGDYSMGGRHTAISGTSITLGDNWALFNNPGALGDVDNTSAFVSYRNRYNINGFHVIGGGAVYHHKLLNIGLKFFKFGDDLFNQQVLGLVIANRIQMVSLGGGINIIQTHVEGFSDRRVVALELGGTAELAPQIILGAHIFNFKHGQQHPTTMKAGLSFRPRDFLMINTEVSKQLDLPEEFAAGVEYRVIPNVMIRTGLNVQGNEVGQSSVNGTYGFGLQFSGLVFDYAFTSETLGDIHEISLSYRITNNP